MTIPESFRLVVGELPAPGRLAEQAGHPFETVTPSRQGYVERDGVKCWYAVWGDTGPGIAPELQDRIFEKFSQGNARVSYQHGGTGLGLSLSRSLATLLGGTLSVQSRPGEGARFTLALPR